MRKLIAVGGVPASGKSTIMKKFLEGCTTTYVTPRKLVSAMHDAQKNLYILGQYGWKDGSGRSTENHGFEGTDKLSMAVQPEAIEFVKTCKENILFEGDRLFNQSFLDFAVEMVDRNELDLHIIIIQADPKIVDQRHVDRKDTQTDTFKKGRETKIDNISSSFILMPYTTYFNNNTEEDLNKIVEHLRLITAI